MKRSITNTILLINILCLAAAWYATPITKMHRWHLIVGSIHQSSSLFLASDGEECSATPEIPSLSIVDTGRTAAANPLTRRPKKGDIVTFTLHKFEPTSSKEVVYPFDTSGTLQLMMHSGHYIPSLHDLLATMNPGETVKSAIIDAEYGPYRDELKITIPTSQLGDVDTSLVKVGTKLAFGDVECAITSMTEEDWVCDANHPMAGLEYEVDVTLESVEAGIRDWGFVDEGDDNVNGRYEVATFALGCFWGGELAYQRMPGVVSTQVGYTQGHVPNPTYKEVCTGTTGHTEAIRVVYDPNVVSYGALVQLGIDRLGDNIYKLNQVGNDRGTQYRHGIYYHSEKQKEIALKLLAVVDATNGKEVMTEIKRTTEFYVAEDYHQQYLMKGGQSAKKGAGETIRCYG